MRESILQNIAARGVGAWLECGQDAMSGEALGDGFEGDANRGRMMREVVDDGDPFGLTDHFLATYHTGE